jgi:acyl carrier protein
MKNELTELILQTAREENLHGVDNPGSVLYGPGAVLDSFGLVRFIVALEAAIEARFAAAVVLANQHAMSQKRSPFRTVDSLASYVEQTLVEAGRQRNL